MDEEIDVAGREDEATAELEGILAGASLAMPGRASALAGRKVVSAGDVKERTGAEPGGVVGSTTHIDQQRKPDPGLPAKDRGIPQVTQADSGDRCPGLLDGVFVVAQLRDVLAAEDSAVVAQENEQRRTLGPETT